MATGKRPPPGSQGARRKRPPTVIDLEASEVPQQSAVPEPLPQPEPQVTAPAPPPEETVIPPSPAAPPQTAFEQASFEPPPPPPPPEPPRAAEPPPDPRPAFAFLPDGPSWSYAVPGIAGVGGGLAVALLFWLVGAFSSGSSNPTPDLSPRLAAIEKHLNDLAGRPAPAAFDPKPINASLDAIAARLARLESAQAAPRAPVTDPVVLGRLNAAESATKSLADNTAALSRRAEAIDAAIRDTNTRIDRLTAALTDVQTTARAAAAGSDRASRLAVAASALRNAVEHGDPFAAELAIVKPLAPDANAIVLLEPFAATGVPGNAALGQELVTLVRPMLRASGEAPRDGNFMDRLQANAQKLVRVRPADEEPRGDDLAAILGRIEQRAAQGNIAGAMTEIDKLPPDARASLQSWTAKAQARNKALDAGRRLSADAVAALKAAP